MNADTRTGAFDELIAEAAKRVVADEAAAFLAIDVTGAELKPGDPERSEENDVDDEERYYTLLRYKCKRCGFELERRYESPEAYGGGMVTCTCGSFNWDPHPLWPRFSWMNGADPYKDLEEYVETTVIKQYIENQKNVVEEY